ncbi:Pkinase-domain-containing protein [Backusella circina FSU 941]|nr:Pkinase-domain-containing protein [Backusella circina FSU 941]
MPTTLASCTDQPYFYPPTIKHQRQPSSRRASAATINSKSRTVGDRRKSSGTLSIQSQKPKKCIGDYIVGKTLGKGASGRVKLGVHRHTGEQVAIKIISKAHLAANPAIEKAVRREIAIMKLVHHPNVMSLIDVIDDPASCDLHLILEYVEGGELFEYLVSKGRLSEQEARHHFQQIILGLDYCHHHLICHRDLKPENLLLNSKNSIKIADFGMASLQPLGSMLETSCGSPHYASPEIVAGLPYNGSSCDIWSCGVILYALLTGHLPFDDENIRQLLKKVKSGKYIMPDNISRQAQDLIRRILVVDPTKRLTVEQIMAHQWFRETEPVNIGLLPVPPTESEIGQPVSDPSEIDDRILETIKFLWGETKDEVVINALIQKEHNMQKVVYVLLQQHAERYWQADHDDESDEDELDGNNTGTTRRRYRTIGLRSERDRQCLSMVETTNAPWMPVNKNDTVRRYSAATIRIEKSPMKKSETFYARFVKNVLSPSRRHKTKPSNSSTTGTVKPSIVGTLRRKNPFTKTINTTDFAISSAPMKQQQLQQQEPISPTNNNNISATLRAKRLSLRIPNAFRNESATINSKKFGFTLGSSNARRQRKQLDLTLFQDNKQNTAPTSPPPASSSDTSSPRKLSLSPAVMNKAGGTIRAPTIFSPRRSSQASSIDKNSTYKPNTPSLLSNSSTTPKASWLSNLFIFKQPKAEIKTKSKDGKSRQVKCRIELIMSDLEPQSCLVQFTQQQGDGVLLNTIVQKLHQGILKEYPCPSTVCSDISFKDVDSADTSGTLVEEVN